MFTEYEQIPHKKANGIFSTATLPENAERSRIREVVPYEENRVELIPTKENNTGYINASHIKVRGVRGIQQGISAGGGALTLPTPWRAGLVCDSQMMDMGTHLSHWQWFLFCPRAAKLLLLPCNTTDNSLQGQTLRAEWFVHKPQLMAADPQPMNGVCGCEVPPRFHLFLFYGCVCLRVCMHTMCV